MPKAMRKTSSIAWTINSPKRYPPPEFQLSRSWFQTPNSYDQRFTRATREDWPPKDSPAMPHGTTLLNPVTGAALGPSDQRSKIGTYNIAPVWTRLIGPTAVFTLAVRATRTNSTTIPAVTPSRFSSRSQAQTFAKTAPSPTLACALTLLRERSPTTSKLVSLLNTLSHGK